MQQASLIDFPTYFQPKRTTSCTRHNEICLTRHAGSVLGPSLVNQDCGRVRGGIAHSPPGGSCAGRWHHLPGCVAADCILKLQARSVHQNKLCKLFFDAFAAKPACVQKEIMMGIHTVPLIYVV